MKRIYIALVCCVPLFLCVRLTHAVEPTFINSTLRVSPILLKIQLEPGSKHIYPISIENLTNAPMPLRANVEGFDPSDEQGGFTPNPPTNVSPLAHWISLSEPDAIIPAHQSHEFQVKISIPPTVPIGGYYAIIYFTPLYQNGSIGSKIGVIALANIGVQDSLKNKAIITEFQFEKMIYEQTPITASLKIKNDALHYFSTKPILTIAPYWGKSDSVDLDEKTILPGKTRSWKRVFTIQNSKWGIYKATVSTSLGNGESIGKTIPLILLPIRYILSALLTFGLVSFIVIKRKNIKKALLAIVADELPDIHVSPPITQEAIESRITPSKIIETLRKNNGSIQKTSLLLGLHRSTIHRWKHRSNNLVRKSTRPHTLRSSTVPASTIKSILSLHSLEHLSAEQIAKRLHLVISVRTIYRILRSYRNT